MRGRDALRLRLALTAAKSASAIHRGAVSQMLRQRSAEIRLTAGQEENRSAAHAMALARGGRRQPGHAGRQGLWNSRHVFNKPARGRGFARGQGEAAYGFDKTLRLRIG